MVPPVHNQKSIFFELPFIFIIEKGYLRLFPFLYLCSAFSLIRTEPGVLE